MCSRPHRGPVSTPGVSPDRSATRDWCREPLPDRAAACTEPGHLAEWMLGRYSVSVLRLRTRPCTPPAWRELLSLEWRGDHGDGKSGEPVGHWNRGIGRGAGGGCSSRSEEHT